MSAPEFRPDDVDGLRVVRLPPASERNEGPVLSFGELKNNQRDVQDRMLELVAFDPHLVDQMNLLLDEMLLVNQGFTRTVREDTKIKWERRLEARLIEARREERRLAIHDWVYTAHPDEAIDQAAGRLVRLVLGWSGESGKAAKAALQALSNLEGAWRAWAGLPGPDDHDGEDTSEGSSES